MGSWLTSGTRRIQRGRRNAEESCMTAPCALLVEDEPDHGLLLRILLERDGFTVVEATTIAAAQRLATTHRPDVVVIDVPDVPASGHVSSQTRGRPAGLAEGPERCRRLRSTPALADVPMVVLSANHDRIARQAYFDVGIDGLLGKPVVPWLLEVQVRAALRRVGGGPDPAALQAENRDWMGYLVHDMNNPLTVIGGSLQLMAMEPLSPRQQRALDSARQAQERLQRLVRALLDVERVSSGGQLRTQIASVSIPALLEEVRFVLTPLAAPRGIDIETATDGEQLWPVDRELLERVLINLGENALRHAPKGSVLELSASVVGDHLFLSVTDQGPGVPTGVRERIFDRSVQAGDSRSPGTAGLGLAFCRLVAQSHGGRAWVEPALGGGASFRLELPAGV